MMQFTQTFLSAYWDLLVMFTFKQDHIDPGLDHSRSILMSYKMLLAKHNDLKRVYKNGFFRRLEWGKSSYKGPFVVEVPLGVKPRIQSAVSPHGALEEWTDFHAG